MSAKAEKKANRKKRLQEKDHRETADPQSDQRQKWVNEGKVYIGFSPSPATTSCSRGCLYSTTSCSRGCFYSTTQSFGLDKRFLFCGSEYILKLLVCREYSPGVPQRHY